MTEPIERLQAVADALKAYPAARGYPDDEQRRYDAARFLAMFDVAVEHAFRQRADELPEMFGGAERAPDCHSLDFDDETFLRAISGERSAAPTVVRPTPESVELAALRRLVELLDGAGGPHMLDAPLLEGQARVEWRAATTSALARARTIVNGDPRKP